MESSETLSSPPVMARTYLLLESCSNPHTHTLRKMLRPGKSYRKNVQVERPPTRLSTHHPYDILNPMMQNTLLRAIAADHKCKPECMDFWDLTPLLP